MMKRLEGVEDRWLKNAVVLALGGFSCPGKNTRVLFCKDTFDYPDLEGHEMLCNHLAPKLKGRPRGKRKKRSISPGGSESNESEASSVKDVPARPPSATKIKTEAKNGIRCTPATRRSARTAENSNERDFLNKLHAFMKAQRTPIGRIPSIGYKEIDMYSLYSRVQKLGGFESVTASRMWKTMFEEVGGSNSNTGGATIIRRHYERLLLPYERNVRGQKYRPTAAIERRRLKSKASSISDTEISEGDQSSNGDATPVATSSYTPTSNSATDTKVRII